MGAPATRPATVLILAGEASGDAHAATVARALRARLPNVRLLGLGGPRLREEGVELLAGLDDLAVMGFVEVLARLRFFWRLERRLRGMLDRGEVDLVLPVDYPGLNLRIAAHAHSQGLPVLYYIAPQVWAWKARRARRLARHADRIAVILPFEEEIFAAEGGRATFVGHPLLDRGVDAVERIEFCRTLGIDPGRPLLALLPGSRDQELDRHLELFLEAARRLQRKHPDLAPILAIAPSVDPDRLASTGAPVTERTRSLLRHARAAIVKSGTSTLEAALESTPFVTVYRTHPVTFALARRLVRVEHVALANLVAGRRIVPELLQGDATPERLVEEVEPLLDERSAERRRMVDGLAGVADGLGEPGAAERVAEIAVRLLRDRRPAGDRENGPRRPGPSSGS